MDSLQIEIANEAFRMGFSFGAQWFQLFLIVVIGVFTVKMVGKL